MRGPCPGPARCRGHGLLGQSSYGLNTYSFSQITAAVMANSKSADDVNAIASLPATDPIPGTHHYVMTPAEAKALGLLGATTTLDGTATFSSTAPFDYDRSDGITAGQYDFQGSVAHEFSEIMGRELNAIGNEVQTGEENGYYLYDLFKFTAEGARSFRRHHSRLFLARQRRHQPQRFQQRSGR